MNVQDWPLALGPVTVVSSIKAPGEATRLDTTPFPDNEQVFQTMAEALAAITKNRKLYGTYFRYIKCSKSGELIWGKEEVEKVLESMRSP